MDFTVLAARRTTGHLALPRAHLARTMSPGWELHFGGASGAVHFCGLLILWKQKGWYKDPCPVTSWRPGPGKNWLSPSALAWTGL